MIEWFKVIDKLPEEKQQCICLQEAWGHKYFSVLTFHPEFRDWEEQEYQYNQFWDYSSEYGWYTLNNVTHWMSLPELPSN